MTFKYKNEILPTDLRFNYKLINECKHEDFKSYEYTSLDPKNPKEDISDMVILFKCLDCGGHFNSYDGIDEIVYEPAKVYRNIHDFDKVTLSGFTVGLPSFYPEGKTFILENPNRALIFDTVTVVGERGEQIKMDLACLYSLMVEYKVDKPDNVS